MGSSMYGIVDHGRQGLLRKRPPGTGEVDAVRKAPVGARGRRGVSLFWRMFLSNAIVLVIATGLLIGPWVTVSSPVLAHEALVLCGV